MTMKMEKIYIYVAEPCYKRKLDANKIQEYLTKNNYKIIKKPEEADKIILITCGAINFLTEYSLNKIKEFKKYDAELIVAGCLPDTDKEELAKFFTGRTLTTKELDKKIEKMFPPQKNIKFRDIEDANILFENIDESHPAENIKKIFRKLRWPEKIYCKIEDHLSKYILGKNSAGYQYSKKQFHIRIAWGCKGNCSYCVINKATSPFHSKPVDECIKEFKKGLYKGYTNFVLDASDVGLYGVDINSSFPELLDKMTKIPGEYKISIREFHPVWLVKYIDKLEEIAKRHKILILDISLQSASTRILKLMNRYSDKEKIKDAILRLKKATHDIFLTVQFIIGFPTETWDEFEETLTFITGIGSNGGQIYLFSCKTGTEAENIKPQIPEEEMLRRGEYADKFLKKNGYFVNRNTGAKLTGLNFVKKS